MRSGTIVLDDSFMATDQTLLQKLLVLLNDGLCGFYVATKTTSNGGQYTYAPGCQPEGRFRCFYVPQGWASFRKDTWVQLEEFFEYPSSLLDAACAGGRFRILDALPTALRTELVKCALDASDISKRWEEAIRPFAC